MDLHVVAAGIDPVRANRRRRRVLIASAFLAMGLAAAGCSSRDANEQQSASTTSVTVNQQAVDQLPPAIRSSGVLRVGKSQEPAAPMAFLKDDGKTWTGIEIDLIDAVAKGLGLKVQYDYSNWDGLIPALEAGRFDVVMDSVGDLTSRQKVVDFVDYAQTNMTAVSRVDNADTIKTTSDLCGKTVGVQTGVLAATTIKTMSDTQCVGKGKPAITIQNFPTDNDGLVALRSGRTDAQVMDSIAADNQTSSDSGKKVFREALTGLSDPTLYGIVVAKSEPNLSQAILTEMKTLVDDGTYAKILNAYDMKSVAVDKPAINAGTTA